MTVVFRHQAVRSVVAWKTLEDGCTQWMAQSTSGSRLILLHVFGCILNPPVHTYPEDNSTMKHEPLKEMLCCMALTQDWLPLPEAVWY